MKQNILIVEDEEKIARLLEDYLRNAGYNSTHIQNGSIVVSFVKKNNPDLILLDLMLPGMNGLDICREIRKFSTVPIIMVTAKSEEIDRLIGLEMGADDYICKPFSPREVVARVKTVLRRVSMETVLTKMTVGVITIELENQQVLINNQQLKLTKSEFNLLKIMMAQPNRVFTRNELLNQVQGYDFDGYDRTIDTHIKNLRKKLRAELPETDVISAVYGSGYKFSYSP